jgi:hypothetical protein
VIADAPASRSTGRGFPDCPEGPKRVEVGHHQADPVIWRPTRYASGVHPASLAFYALLSFTLLLLFVWVGIALAYQLPGGITGKSAGIASWLLIATFALGCLWRGHEAMAAVIALSALTLFYLWWASILPSDTREWADEVALHLTSEVAGDVVTLNNVRNFDWRSEQDYTVRWETRRFDLRRVQWVDVAASYWMGPAIAHTLVSFGFSDGQIVTFSIEIRKKRNEAFSAIGGFFKQFEATLVAAEERDILRVRTNMRGEDVYLYRISAMRPDAMRSLFRAYLAEGEALCREPRWYRTLTANCTTIVYTMARRIVGGLPLDYRLLLSGYLPNYLYDVGALTRGHDFQTLRNAGRITDRAKAADADPAFSRRIREGIPGMAPDCALSSAELPP